MESIIKYESKETFCSNLCNRHMYTKPFVTKGRCAGTYGTTERIEEWMLEYTVTS